MDPVSVLGITNTALCLADQLGKTLKFLYQLSTKLKYAEIKITLLAGYLGSLNAAIVEIAEIVKGLSEHIQYQKLAESLSMTLDCTNLSLSFLEAKLDGLRLSDERTMADKIAMLLRNSEFEDYVNGISCHVNALNLLLNTLQSRSLLEQQKILTSVDADSIIEAMRDETSSLHCLADTASASSRQSIMSETSAAFDTSFDFDAEILSSKTYAVAYRSHLRQAVTSRKRRALPVDQAVSVSFGDTGAPSNGVLHSRSPASDVRMEHLRQSYQVYQSEAHDPPIEGEIPNTLKATTNLEERLLLEASKETSSEIAIEGERTSGPNLQLEGDVQFDRIQTRTAEANIVRPEFDPLSPSHVKMLLFGISESGKSTVLKGIKLHEDGAYTKNERSSFSEVFFSNLTLGVHRALEAMESLDIPFDTPALEHHVNTIFMQPIKMNSIPPEVCDAIRGLIRDEGFRAALNQQGQYHLLKNMDFYMRSIDRIFTSDHLPYEKDILYSRIKATGITETIVPTKEDSGDRTMELFIYDVVGARSDRQMWLRIFRDVDIILFTVDIACYDQFPYEDGTVNQMQAALTMFNSIIDSNLYSNTKMVLCFTKRAKLAEKIEYSPLEGYFPDFVPTEPPNLQDSMAYIIAQFTKLDRRKGRSSDRLLTTVVLQDALDPTEWQAIKEVAWNAFDAKQERLAADRSRIERQPTQTWRSWSLRRAIQRRESM